MTTSDLPSPLRTTAKAVAAGLGLGSLPVAVLAVRPELQSSSMAATVVACGIPYLPASMAGVCTAMAVASRSRWPRLAWLSGGALAVAVGYRTWFGATAEAGPVPDERCLRVVSMNVLHGRGDPHQIVDLVRNADLLAVQENTPAFDEALGELLSVDFPYTLGTSTDDGHGTMLWSRTPLALEAMGETAFTSVVATTTVRGVRWTVANVHPAPPHHGSKGWNDDGRRILELVTPYLGEQFVMVGDFNAIDEHVTMRRLVAAGLRNAMRGWRSSGAAAWQPSWPTNVPGVPPVIRIDHALHSASVNAWRPRYVVLDGSDHKAVVVQFRAR